MRILFLLPDFPYPSSTGGRVKVFNELLFLSKNHQCDLLCIGNPSNEDKLGLITALPNVRLLKIIPAPSSLSKKIGALWNIIRLLPPSLAAFNSDKFAYEVKKTLLKEKYDVIHYDIINMAQYLSLGKGIPSVHSPNDATSMTYTRLAQHIPWSIAKIRLLLSAWLLRRYERNVYPCFTKVHVVSEVDASYLKKIDPKIDIDVIPIAFDIYNKSESANIGNHNNFSKNIICTGNFVNPAISKGVQDFISEVFLIILQSIPNIKLIILGKNANEKLIKLIKNNSKIEYVEFADDYEKFILQADVILAPDQSGAPGAKTRVLQAMGLGLPVVGTSSAFEGISIVKYVHGFVYSSMAECAVMMLRLLIDDEERKAVGESGKNLVINQFSLKTIGPKYENLYINAINNYL